jgi:hypothetical protein
MEILVGDLEIDDYNAEEMAAHDVTPAEVYEVLESGKWNLKRNPRAATTGTPYIMVGVTHAGRLLYIPIQPISPKDGLWRPATAFTP